MMNPSRRYDVSTVSLMWSWNVRCGSNMGQIMISTLQSYWNLYLCDITVFHQCATETRTNKHDHEHYNYMKFHNYITIDLVNRN
jgi:hypothetical protein